MPKHIAAINMQMNLYKLSPPFTGLPINALHKAVVVIFNHISRWNAPKKSRAFNMPKKPQIRANAAKTMAYIIKFELFLFINFLIKTYNIHIIYKLNPKIKKKIKGGSQNTTPP